MSHSSAPVSDDLRGQRIAVPETRQLDVLVELLERRGAEVMRLPLVSILDAADPAPVEQWLRRFIDDPGDLFIILTGEGIRRLRGFAERAGLHDDFREALSRVHKLCRGPKPGRALKEMDLKPDQVGAEPTTPGIIQTMKEMSAEHPLAGQRIHVQLYGEDPNQPLMDFLAAQGANVLTVAPYRYAPASDEVRILDFIHQLGTGRITAITFTSQPQFSRLIDVARRHEREQVLLGGLDAIHVVAVGPVVADQLASHGVRVEVMPESSFFMKPMVTALARHVSRR